MAYIMALYASVLALAVWQEEHPTGGPDCGNKGC